MKDLTKGNISKTFFMFAIPMVLSGMLSQAYATINTIMAGKLLGDNALAAIGSLAPFSTFINSVFWGYGMGMGVYVAHLFGAEDFVKMKRVIVNNFRFIFSLVLILSGVFLLFRWEIYRILKIDPAILSDCNRYFTIVTAGKVFILSLTFCVLVFNAIGDSAFPLKVSSLSAILNIAIGAMGIVFLHMGVAAMAWSSVLSAVICFGIYCCRLGAVFKKMQIIDVKTPVRFLEIKEVSRYAVSTMVQQSTIYFAGLILSPMINGIGGAASASYSVSLRIYDINANICFNTTKTVGSFTAQCYGAKKYHLLKKGVWMGALQALVLVIPVLLTCCLFAKHVTSVFYTKEANPESVQYTIVFLRYFLPFLVFNMLSSLFHNFFRGIGRMRALLITTIVGCVVRIIISAVLIKPFGIYGYYAGWVLSWIADGAVGAGLYFFGSWRKRLVNT